MEFSLNYLQEIGLQHLIPEGRRVLQVFSNLLSIVREVPTRPMSAQAVYG
jgi:hypothetical protein